jgi:FKBP-type peptidyl-prolyl cis-trans isomerase
MERSHVRLGWTAVIGLALLCGVAGAADTPRLGTDRDKESYVLGVSLARGVEREGVAVDPELVARGLQDALAGRPLALGDEELRAATSRLEGARQPRKVSPAATAAEAKKQGAAFLAENAKKEGVVTLPSGLQYRILKAGDGRVPTDADRVVCHYRGRLIDGTEFDSSFGRGRPATFDVARVIPGWREALKLMPAGSKWQLFIPPELAYGERGVRGRRKSPAKVGPNTTLVFETELLAVQPRDGKAEPETKTAAAAPAATEDRP